LGERLGSCHGRYSMNGPMPPKTKTDLRREARIKRKALARADFAGLIARHAEALDIKRGDIVGGYHAMPDEADPSLLLARLVEMGAHVAFPRVAAKGMPLEFHLVPDGEVLAPGHYGIPEPMAHWPAVKPALLLVPLLAFDVSGHRLGYGGGFYDRTLEALNVPAIGIAYAGQEVPAIPAEPHDRRLDMILTEYGLTTLRE
jgi:5-formyltetrahydrofolate cyclo-ligase